MPLFFTLTTERIALKLMLPSVTSFWPRQVLVWWQKGFSFATMQVGALDIFQLVEADPAGDSEAFRPDGCTGCGLARRAASRQQREQTSTAPEYMVVALSCSMKQR